jgi:hypothetical protein
MRRGQPWIITIRAVPVIGGREPTIRNLISELQRAVVRAVHAYNGLPRRVILGQVRGYLQAENLRDGQVRRHTGPLARLEDLREGVFEQVIIDLQESNVFLEIYDLRWNFIIDPRSIIVGAGTPKIPEGVSRMFEPTWKTQTLDGTVINCAAYAIAHAMAFRSAGSHKASLPNKPILIKAREIMTRLNWPEYVSVLQIEQFVKAYPEYRVTIILCPATSHQGTTYEGPNFEY